MSILLPRHSASLHITHNDHKSSYETALQWIEHRELALGEPVDWVAEGEREKAIAADSIWELQWYPDTPVGFCIVASSTLSGILKWVQENCPDAEVQP